MRNIIKEKFGKIPSANVYVGKGLIFGDLDYNTKTETFTHEVIRRTSPRIFIRFNKYPKKNYYIDPIDSQYYQTINNPKQLSEYIFDVPKYLSRKEIKGLCGNLNNLWNDLGEKVSFRDALENKIFKEHVEALPIDKAFETYLTKEELNKQYEKSVSKETLEENKKIIKKVIKHVKTSSQGENSLSK